MFILMRCLKIKFSRYSIDEEKENKSLEISRTDFEVRDVDFFSSFFGFT